MITQKIIFPLTRPPSYFNWNYNNSINNESPGNYSFFLTDKIKTDVNLTLVKKGIYQFDISVIYGPFVGKVEEEKWYTFTFEFKDDSEISTAILHGCHKWH